MWNSLAYGNGWSTLNISFCYFSVSNCHRQLKQFWVGREMNHKTVKGEGRFLWECVVHMMGMFGNCQLEHKVDSSLWPAVTLVYPPTSIGMEPTQLVLVAALSINNSILVPTIRELIKLIFLGFSHCILLISDGFHLECPQCIKSCAHSCLLVCCFLFCFLPPTLICILTEERSLTRPIFLGSSWKCQKLIWSPRLSQLPTW